MDTDHRELVQSEPEVTSPVHAVGEGTSESVPPDQSNPSNGNVPRTTRIDTTNLGPSAATTSENGNFYDTSSLQHLTQPIRQTSVRLPLSPARRLTRNESEIDWIVPKEEKVSNPL